MITARALRIILKNLKFVVQSRFRVCNCCQKHTLVISFSEGEERKLCIRCRANLRYEMLAREIRRLYPDLSGKTIVELDPKSPLRSLFINADGYIRTYYSPSDEPKTIRHDGARCENITCLTLSDNSVDLMVSSDVLEHVHDFKAALTESARVLVPGGMHIFTVPTAGKTLKRAEWVDGHINYLTTAEYHSDPLSKNGILAYWTFGYDMPDLFSIEGAKLCKIAGPEGRDGRVVWGLEKLK